MSLSPGNKSGDLQKSIARWEPSLICHHFKKTQVKED